MFDSSALYLENFNERSDIVVNQGGTWSGKTYSIMQVLFSFAIQQPKVVITITGHNLPNLKGGSLRDALTIMENSEALNRLIANYNKSEHLFEFVNGSVMEFKSYTDSQDARNGKRDYLFVNEANGVNYEIFKQLELRTKIRTFVDYNPSAEFWVHEKLIGQPGVRLIISDHRRNIFISQKQHDKIEALKNEDPELWKVYARGMTGKIEGLIFRNWFKVADFPADSKLISYGLDFGFTNDPTAITEVCQQDGELFVKLHIYETGLTNPDISRRMTEEGLLKHEWLIADSAEPKSIAELSAMGWKVEPANKGADSVKNGIDILKRYKLNIIDPTGNLTRELNTYKWKVDRLSGKSLNEPIDAFNHAIDSLRYVALNKLNSGNRYGEYVIV